LELLLFLLPNNPPVEKKKGSKTGKTTPKKVDTVPKKVDIMPKTVDSMHLFIQIFEVNLISIAVAISICNFYYDFFRKDTIYSPRSPPLRKKK